jgi:serine/threonine-protein kinase HipA
MELETFEITLDDTLVGHVYRYAKQTKLMFADSYINNPNRRQLSVSFAVPNNEVATRELLAHFTRRDRTGESGRLPSFLSNCLPEGVLRDRIAALAGTHRDDEFAILAACAQDLPGALHVNAINAPDRALMQRLVTQNHDALEPTVVPRPIAGAVSLSGIQPKLQLSKDTQGRYTFVAKRGRQHFIGKLPAPSYAGLPEVEYASMQLARAAGVNTADCELVPMRQIEGEIALAHGSGAHFLSIKRFDRDASSSHAGYTRGGRLHMEDFCQVLSLSPQAKYDGSYLQIMAVLAGLQRPQDVEELARRLVVNELLGNFDAHLKNFSLLYTTARQPVLSPAYDIVAYACYLTGQGAALRWLPNENTRATLNKDTLWRLVQAAQDIVQRAGLHTPITPQRLQRIAVQTRELAFDVWPSQMKALPLNRAQQAKLKKRWAVFQAAG